MLRVLELFAGLKIKVYDDGTIESFSHDSKRSNGRVDNRKGKIIKPGLDKYGYYRVTFSHKGQRKSYYVHRLVAQTFIPNPENKPTVNHKNGIKTDNRLENLEWSTQKEQKRHSIDNHLCDKNIKALADHNVKVSRKVRFMGVVYSSIREASRLSGFHKAPLREKEIFYVKGSRMFCWFGCCVKGTRTVRH